MMDDIAREQLRLDKVSEDIAQYVWKILFLYPDETVDSKTRDDFEIEIRKML